MHHKPDVSIIIVNFNTRSLTLSCLDAIYTDDNAYTKEVIVSDNGSVDDSIASIRKKYPNVILIENKKNLGFAAANNQGIKIARGRFILLLNSDVEVSKHTISYMSQFMDAHPDVGAATCALFLPNGTLDPACHRGFPTPWVAFTYMAKLEHIFPKTKLFGEYHQGYKDMTKIHEVDSISGAFFMVPRKVIDTVGMLDESYFMYGEDLDLAYAIRKAGKSILFVPAVSALHKKKQSGRSHENTALKRQSERYFHQNNWLFYKKNLASRYGFFMNAIVSLFYKIRLSFL